MRHSIAVALALALLPSVTWAEPPWLEPWSRIVVAQGPEKFGGLSALLVEPDGSGALLLSDRARLFDARLIRNAAGRLTGLDLRGVTDLEPGPWLFRDFDPEKLPERMDTEGLARAPNDGIFVSVENPPAVLRFDRGGTVPDKTWRLRLGIRKPNRRLEALAADMQGRPVTVPEIVPDKRRDFPILRRQKKEWLEVGRLAPRGRFSVVGADFGPDGRLYVLERAASLLGFRSRIRRLDVARDGSEETLLTTAPAAYDNLEGLSIWQAADGSTILTLVSDDNFLSLQRTEIVEFRLRE